MSVSIAVTVTVTISVSISVAIPVIPPVTAIVGRLIRVKRRLRLLCRHFILYLYRYSP
ncbi:hypothetical protein D3C73_1340950 [compost metagenome]